jgi:mono/diheme cytochrome c family protein
MKFGIPGAALCIVLFATALCSAQRLDTVEGPALYKAYCATCHGVDAKGVGPMTQWLKIEAPDLTRIARREAGKFPLARIQRIIAGDENITKGHGSREMPVWGPVFSQVANDQDFGKVRIYNLAKYIEKLQAR